MPTCARLPRLLRNSHERLASLPRDIKQLAPLAICLAIDGGAYAAVPCGGAWMFSEIRQQANRVLIEKRPQRVIHGLQFHVDERIVETAHAASIELIAQAVPRMLGRSPLLVPIHQDMALIGVQVECQAAFGEFVGAAQIFEACEHVAISKNRTRISRESKPIANPALAQLCISLVGVCSGVVNRSVRLAVTIVVDNQRTFIPC